MTKFSDENRLTIVSFPNYPNAFDIVVVLNGKPIEVIKECNAEQKRAIYSVCDRIANADIERVKFTDSDCKQGFSIVRKGEVNVNHDQSLVSER